MKEALLHEALAEGEMTPSFATDASYAYKAGDRLNAINGPTIAIMLPTYREAQNIEKLIREIQSLNLNGLVLVVDDSSPDGTANIVRRLQKEYDNIILFVRPAKLGLGTAITAGFRLLLSLEKPPDYVVAMDSDYSHNPKDIPRLINSAEQGNDLVIGSRYSHGGKTKGWPLERQVISHVANLIATLMVGTRTQDCTSGFRCYSINYVRSVIGDLHSQTYEIQIETVKQARTRKFRIGEVPIVFSNRKRGKSKLTKAEFRDFLAYVIKSKFGVKILSEERGTELKNSYSKAHGVDEGIERLIDLYRRVRFS